MVFGDNGSYFDAKNDLMIASDGYPAVYNQRKLSFYCRGRNRDSDNSEVTVTYSIWEEIIKYIKDGVVIFGEIRKKCMGLWVL